MEPITLELLRATSPVYTVGEITERARCCLIGGESQFCERGMVDLEDMLVTIDSSVPCAIARTEDTPGGVELHLLTDAVWVLTAPSHRDSCATVHVLRGGIPWHVLHAWVGAPSPALTPASSSVSLLRGHARVAPRA